jgi:hypothetical protein
MDKNELKARQSLLEKDLQALALKDKGITGFILLL